MKRIATVLFLAFTAVGCGNAQSGNVKTSLDARVFQKEVAAHPDAPVIDVRTPEEFTGGHLENALNYNWNDDNFDANIANLDKSQPVYVYCLSGGRSAAAAAHMRGLGFSEVYELNGGMMKWRAANLPETTAAVQTVGMSRMDFEKLVTTDKTVLVDFYAEWCAPCKKMKPYLDEIAGEMKETVTVVRIDVDKNPELARELKIDALPTLQVYKKGQLWWSNVGYVEKNEVVQHLK